MASVGARALASGEVRWRVQHRVDGKMMQKTFVHPEGAERFKSLVERIGWKSAEAALTARQQAARTPTLREWVTTYLDPASGMLTGVEEATRDGYQRAAERSFLEFLGDMPVDAITKSDVGRWVTWQEQQPSKWRQGNVSMKTVQNYHSILSAALRAAVEAKLREDNPAWKTRITRGTKREGVFLSVEEFTTLLHFVPDRYTGLVMFLAGTGARWGEATALTWADLDLASDPPTVRISKAWKRGLSGNAVLKQPKSKRSRRTVSLSPDVVDALGTPGPLDELLFLSKTGRNLRGNSFRTSVWSLAIARAQDPEQCAAAGLPVLTKTPNVHDLRHTHASWLIADGTPLPFVQARLGHESFNTTVNIYGHLQPDAHVQMSASISRTLAGVRPDRTKGATRLASELDTSAITAVSSVS